MEPILVDAWEEDGREIEVYNYKGEEIYYNYYNECEYTVGEYWYNSLNAAKLSIELKE